MADHEHSTIKHQDHVLLDQPLLRLPYELLRNNFRAAHFTVEKDSTSIKSLLKETATGSVNGRTPPDQVLKNLDAMISKMRGVKRKLNTYADEETRLQSQSAARVAHAGELYSMHSYDDVKYETWSRKRLDRLLVDYLLRHGYNHSAQALTDEKDIEELVDVQTFLQMSKIQASLRDGSVQDALAWCQDNKKELRKMDSNLEFMLRFQQYIELVRTQSQPKLIEAIAHAKKYLIPFKATYPSELMKAFGLLAYSPDAAATSPTYSELYSAQRWNTLADLFTSTHNQLLALPSFPLLHIALSSGLSALKTPACHSSAPASTAAVAGGTSSSGESHPNASMSDVTDSSASPEPQQYHPPRHHRHEITHKHDSQKTASAAGVPPSQTRPAVTSPAAACPICSSELNDLARNVPYAHHTKSHVDADLMLLPSGNAFGHDRLEDYARKSGLQPEEEVRDLRTGRTYPVGDLKKVYIT